MTVDSNIMYINGTATTMDTEPVIVDGRTLAPARYVAEAFGAKGFSASTPAEFEEVFKKALQEKGPVWIDCAIAKEERVLPMIPGGGTVEDMIIG
jgi:thiamine pyrophosphate-dependent acetolactate synthase large subunit-like protein